MKVSKVALRPAKPVAAAGTKPEIRKINGRRRLPAYGPHIASRQGIRYTSHTADSWHVVSSMRSLRAIREPPSNGLDGAMIGLLRRASTAAAATTDRETVSGTSPNRGLTTGDSAPTIISRRAAEPPSRRAAEPPHLYSRAGHERSRMAAPPKPLILSV